MKKKEYMQQHLIKSTELPKRTIAGSSVKATTEFWETFPCEMKIHRESNKHEDEHLCGYGEHGIKPDVMPKKTLG